MKIHGSELLRVVVPEYTEFPTENVREGEIAFINNELYIYTDTGTTTEWQKATADQLSELLDVELTNLQNGEALVWDSALGKFKNSLIETGPSGNFLEATGDIVEGDLIPDTANTRSLGTSAIPFKEIHAEHGYFGANSLYINGKKVISDESDQIYITTDPNQDLITKTVDNGDIRWESGNRLDGSAPGGINLIIPSDQANKDIHIDNSSLGGDVDLSANANTSSIGLSSLGTNGGIQLFAQDEIDMQAQTIYLVGNTYVNGHLLNPPFENEITISEDGGLITSDAKQLDFGDSFTVATSGSSDIVTINYDKEHSLNDLIDVVSNNPSDDDIISYNSSTSKFELKNIATTFLNDLPSLQVRNSDTNSLTTSWQNINWPTLDISNNTDVLEHNSGDNARIDIKEDGFYFINFETNLRSSSNIRSTYVQILKNGTDIIPGSEMNVYTYSTEIQEMSQSCIVYLVAGDYIHAQVRANSTPLELRDSTKLLITRLNGIKGEKGDKGDPGSAGATSIDIQKEGSTVSAVAETINFTGDVDVTLSSPSVVDVNVTASAGGFIPTVIQVFDGSGGQQINNTSFVAIDFDEETYKDDTYLHSNSSNESRVYVNTRGLYKISYSVSYDGDNGRKNIECRARKNGSTYINPSVSYAYSRNSTDDKATCSTTFMVELNTNDYIEILAIREGSSGSAYTIADESWMIIELVKET